MKKKIILFIMMFCLVGIINLNIVQAENQRNYDKSNTSATFNTDITIKSEIGISDMYKYDRSVPLKITLTNGNEEFVGKVQIIEVIDTKDTIIYEYDVQLTSNSNIYIDETIFLKTNLAIKIQVIDDNGNIVAKDLVKLDDDKLLSGTLTIGVISRNSDKYSVFEASQIANFGEISSKVFYIEDMLPFTSYQNLEMLDIIMINNYDTSTFDEQTIKVLQEWVFDGGVLIVGTGRYINSTLAMFDEWYDIDITGNSYYTKAWLLEDEYTLNNIPIYDLKINGAELGYSYNEEKETDTVKIKYLGNGRVVFLEFNIEEDGIIQLLDNSLENLGEFFSITIGYDLMNEIKNEYYNRFNNLWSISNILSSIIFENLPSMRIYIIVLGIYFFIIGPVVYYLYKKKKNFYFSVIIATSIIFTMLIYLIGKKTRFDEAFINYASIIKVDSNVEIETTFFSIRNSLSTPFSFGIKDEYNIEPQFIELGDNADVSGYEKASIIRRKSLDSYIIDIKNTKAFDEKNFKVVKSTKTQEKNFGNISYVNGVISGVIHNPLYKKLESVILLIDNNIIYVGDIEPQKEVDITKCEVIPIDAHYYSEIVDYVESKSSLKKIILQQRRGIFEYFADYNFNDFYNNPQIIAFTSNGKEFNAQTYSNYDANGITLYSINIDVDMK